MSRYDTVPPRPVWPITDVTSGLNARMASASSIVRIGLLRVRSSSSSLRIGGWRWIVNESAPTSLMIAVETMAFMPWISVTTVTMDVTATMFPSTVMNERSLFAQMAPSAMKTDSRIWFMRFRRG